MFRSTAFICAAILFVAIPVQAQRGGSAPLQHGNPPRANQGHIPPPPQRSPAPTTLNGERLNNGRVNEAPHVNHDQWFGHEPAGDNRFRVDRPFEHGRFTNGGPAHRFNILRIDRDHHRFWFPGGFYFEVAMWDWPIFTDWCWNCGDDFVIYDDPDHIGWYLLYNIHTGVYVHVQYLGM